MESWMHRQVAKDVAGKNEAPSTLEIGAGTLNHLRYEPPSSRYDVVEPITALAANSPLRSRIGAVFEDVRDVRERRYERIISVAAFEHYANLPDIVSCCSDLLVPGGKLRVAIPSEGALLWTLGWKLTTGLEFRRRYGLDYSVLMKHEHVNTATEIEAVLRAFFSTVKRSLLGITANLSFYQFFECS
jgi:hypothetical protein